MNPNRIIGVGIGMVYIGISIGKDNYHSRLKDGKWKQAQTIKHTFLNIFVILKVISVIDDNSLHTNIFGENILKYDIISFVLEPPPPMQTVYINQGNLGCTPRTI